MCSTHRGFTDPGSCVLPHSHLINSGFALSISRLSNSQSINIQILGTTTTLMIANVTEEDYGNYTCVASNRLGIQNASLFLYSTYAFLYSPLALFRCESKLPNIQISQYKASGCGEKTDNQQLEPTYSCSD